VNPTHTYAAAGLYTVTLTVTDDGGLTDTAATTADIAAVNDAPIAVDDAYTTDEDTSLNVPAPGVLANDSDPDGDALNAVLGTGPANGTLVLNANGSFSYTPSLNFNGVDSFTYLANDGQVDSNLATVTITVNAVNDAPVADPNGPYAGSEGVPLTLDGSGSSDVDGTIVAYDWDFGDGSTGAGVNPTHTYAAAGLYTVTLTVTDDGGLTDTARCAGRGG
jgi:VCBS repeat-containing protein